MQNIVSLWPLFSVGVITLAFILRLHPMLAVILAALTACLTAHIPLIQILNIIGTGFIKTRNLSLLVLLPLAVIGLMERHGIREKAQQFIASIKSVTVGKLLIIYLLLRQLTASIGLTSLGGHPQMVRPILAPMVEGAANSEHGTLSDDDLNKLRAYSAATDNIGLFFGEDIFVAFGAVALIATFLHDAGVKVELLHIALWGIPTAICTFIIHAYRLQRLDKKLKIKYMQTPTDNIPQDDSK